MFRNALNNLLDIRDLKRAERETNEDGGFTLIELLVVVVIIGILIAIAIPLYLNYTNGAKNKGAESDVRAAVSAVQQCYTDNSNAFPATATGSGSKGANLVFACGANQAETATVSSGTTLTYTYTSATNSYTIAGVTDGSKTTYTFDSTTGKVTQNTTA